MVDFVVSHLVGVVDKEFDFLFALLGETDLLGYIRLDGHFHCATAILDPVFQLSFQRDFGVDRAKLGQDVQHNLIWNCGIQSAKDGHISDWISFVFSLDKRLTSVQQC